MAKNLIPEELQALIQQYLTDGILTDKERQVILKKAEGMGLDRDEIDLYLDAEEQKIEQQTDAAVRKQKGKTCPYCGGNVPQLADKCPHCGESITVQASEELQEIFDNLETALVNMKAGEEFDRSKATVERYSRKAKTYYGSNPKMQKLLEEVENEMNEAEKRSKRIVQQQTLSKIISNKWVWTAAVAIIFGLLFLVETYKKNEANERYENYSAQQWAHPENQVYGGTRSLEYTQIVAEKNKAYDESKSIMNIVYLILGIGATGFFASLAVKDSKKMK